MKIRLERGKNMKRNKGFTLIELLAVIVILAIIALIAVPVVMNIISKANKSAFKDSAYGVLKAGENYYMGELLNAQGMTSDKVFDFSKDTSELEINGSKPTNGKMIVNTNGKISMAIHNGRHCVTKGFNDDDVTISDDITNCKNPALITIVDLAVEETFTKVDGSAYESEDDPAIVIKPACLTNGQECAAGTPVAIQVNKTETYKFYVLSDTGSEVTLIMDRNLYSDEDLANNTHNVAWMSADDYVDNDSCTYDACNDQGPLTALTALNERTKEWTNIPVINSYEYTNTEGTYGYQKLKIENGLGKLTSKDGTTISEIAGVSRARLLTYEEATSTSIGCTTSSGSCPSWLQENYDGTGDNNTYGYWLLSADPSHPYIGHTVDYYGRVNNNGVNLGSRNGVRPVITLSK